MVCLQGHLDMVCEKNSDKVHDFEKDPIELVRKGNVLMANGTTLGADNGIAVATNLAIMEDQSLEHGPLEFLFTVDEEMGLNGANSLQPGFVQGKTLLNLDSEEEGALYVGCSGGRNTEATWKVATDDAAGRARAGAGESAGTAGRALRPGDRQRAGQLAEDPDARAAGTGEGQRPHLPPGRRQQEQRDPARGGGPGVSSR